MPPLPPVTRRLVGLLNMLAGFMLLAALVLRLGVTYWAYQQAGPAALYNREMVLSLVLFTIGVLQHPFDGDVRVQQDAFEQVVEDIGG